jgi:AhpD family alkylhydroperoxidase
MEAAAGMASNDFHASMKKARAYGLDEFLDIMGELSQESTKKGLLGRKCKELVTLAIALNKQCGRCIDIHSHEAIRLGASEAELNQVRKIVLFLNASPNGSVELWDSWEDSWREFALTRGALEHHHRELIALAIALVQQRRDHIMLHVTCALEHGAAPDEVFEVLPIALLMDGAPVLSQITHLVGALEHLGHT